MFVRLKAAASSISTVAGNLEDVGRRRITECVREMLTVIDHMQAMNRVFSIVCVRWLSVMFRWKTCCQNWSGTAHVSIRISCFYFRANG